MEKPPEPKPQDESTPKNTQPIAPSCPYKIPKWSRPPMPDDIYKFEVLKSGIIIDEVKELQQQATWKFGRLPDNDVAMSHPTISRYHAVLQYKPKAEDSSSDEEDDEGDQTEGWYVYDLGSTHGTFLNKQRIPERVYIRIRVGHMLKLGNSTRVYILQGPGDDEEPESELTVTELREQKEQKVAAAAAEKERKKKEAEERERNEGASWGMGEDADEETDLTHNPYASTNNEELFFDDPKRTLRGYFEREGLNLEYKCDELSQGSFVCRVELPLDDSNGRPIVVEVTHKGRKKDCVVQCALEACRTLDRHGVLRQANQEAQKRKIVKNTDSDDEDEFWDRTGDVARKKQRKACASTNVTLTYEDLLKQETELNIEMAQVEHQIGAYHQNEKRMREQAEKQKSADDDLDNFMDTLSDNVTSVDKTEIKKLRLEEQRIKAEQLKLQRLIKIAKPTMLPFTPQASCSTASINTQQRSADKKQLPMIGKRNQFSKFKVVKMVPSTTTKAQTAVFASEDEEVEEEEEEGEKLAAETVTEPSTSELSKETTATDVVTEADSNISLATADVINTDNVVLSEAEVAEILTLIEEIDTSASTSSMATTIVDSATSTATATATSTATTTATSTTTATTTATAVAADDDTTFKKPRARPRQRQRQRQDVDMDINQLAEHEDSEKYAKWVPPTNQSGDGITHLNEKFGY
ncbi:CG7706 [Drosophila busckii]|uniref:CG7706 n=2 Tax=Drosophila busckii TaxID=30019 RepID=A0A0M4F2V8_DROBS|nr:CG7706 [Drosophila busckii]